MDVPSLPQLCVGPFLLYSHTIDEAYIFLSLTPADIGVCARKAGTVF